MGNGGGQVYHKEATKDKNIRRFDMQLLVEQFTEYYPQVFFEGRIILPQRKHTGAGEKENGFEFTAAMFIRLHLPVTPPKNRLPRPA